VGELNGNSESEFHFIIFALHHVVPLAHFFITVFDYLTIIIMDVITPLNNLPNLKQGQNGEEVALEIYGIVLDVKAHLPAPKETAVSSLFFVIAIIVDCHRNYFTL
jgi:hypothetical protein